MMSAMFSVVSNNNNNDKNNTAVGKEKVVDPTEKNEDETGEAGVQPRE
jgi:hypothetical protein